jgi:hypothetical protein
MAVLHRRLTSLVLLVTLVGANASMASVCEAYCAGAVKEKRADHHDATVTRISLHHQTHAHHNPTNCPECRKSAPRLSLQQPGCGTFTGVQALVDDSRVFSDERPVVQIGTANSRISLSPMVSESQRFSPFHSPPRLSSFEPILVSLRI